MQTGIRIVGMYKDCKLIRELAMSMAVPAQFVHHDTFPDGERRLDCSFEKDPHRVEVLVFRLGPAMQGLEDVLFLIDALRISTMQHVIVYIPYFPYSRQIKRATQLARSLQAHGATKIFTLDAHQHIDGVGSTSTAGLFFQYASGDMVVGPDQGAIGRVHELSSLCSAPFVCAHKRRRQSVRSTLPIQIKCKNVVVFDDILSTGKTLRACLQLLADNGVARVDVCISHMVGDYGSLPSFGMKVQYFYTDSLADEGLSTADLFAAELKDYIDALALPGQ